MKAHEGDSAHPGSDPGIERDEFTHYLLRVVQDSTVLRRPHHADPGGWVITLLVGGDYRATEATRWALSALMAAGLIEWEAYTARWALPGAERARLTARGRRLLWRFDVELGLISSPGDPVADSPGEGLTDPEGGGRRVYAVCGSARFSEAFAVAAMHLSSRGHLVIGLLDHAAERVPAAGDRLRFRGIDLADVVYVVNVGCHVGPGTRAAVAYAHSAGKAVEWMFPGAGAATDSAFSAHAGHDGRATPGCPYCPPQDRDGEPLGGVA